MLLSKEPSGCKEAEALYRRVLVMTSDDLVTLCNLADLLSKEPSGREEAEALYRRALAVDPDHVSTLNNLAYTLSEELGGREEAVVITGERYWWIRITCTRSTTWRTCWARNRAGTKWRRRCADGRSRWILAMWTRCRSYCRCAAYENKNRLLFSYAYAGLRHSNTRLVTCHRPRLIKEWGA